MSVRHFNGNCERFHSQTTNVILIDFYRWKRTCYYMKIHYVSFLLLYWWCCWSLRHIFSTSCSKQNPKFAYFHICTASLIVLHWYRFWLIDFWCFNAIFSYIMTTSFSVGRSWREPLTMGKQLVNFIACGC